MNKDSNSSIPILVGAFSINSLSLESKMDDCPELFLFSSKTNKSESVYFKSRE